MIFEEDAQRAQHTQEAAYLACSTCSVQHILRAACNVCTDFRAYTQATGLPSSFIGPDACAAHQAYAAHVAYAAYAAHAAIALYAAYATIASYAAYAAYAAYATYAAHATYATYVAHAADAAYAAYTAYAVHASYAAPATIWELHIDGFALSEFSCLE